MDKHVCPYATQALTVQQTEEFIKTELVALAELLHQWVEVEESRVMKRGRHVDNIHDIRQADAVGAGLSSFNIPFEQTESDCISPRATVETTQIRERTLIPPGFLNGFFRHLAAAGFAVGSQNLRVVPHERNILACHCQI